MKKILLAIATVIILALSLQSCRSTKPPCPAYTQQTPTVEQTNVHYAR